MSTDIGNALVELEQHVQMLQQAPAPSTQLVDALNELAHAYNTVDIHKGISAAQSASMLARLLRYPQGEADSMIELSWMLLQDGRLDTAYLQAQHAQYLAKQLDDSDRLAKCMHVLAVVQHEAGNFSKAELLWQQLLVMARKQGNRAREADYLTALGILRQDQSDLALSYEYKQQAHEIYVELNDPNLVISLNNMAYLLTKMGRHHEALNLGKEALQKCPDQNVAWRSTILHTLGLIELHLTHFIEARRLLTESINLAQRPGAQKQQAIQSLMELSKLEWECNDMPAACVYLMRALALAEEIKSIKLQSQAHQSLYRFYLQMKAYEAASQHHERYVACEHEIGCNKIEKQIQIIRANAALQNLQPEWARDSQTWLHAA